MAGLWGFGLGLVCQKLGCWWRGTMIAVFEISQQIPSDCLQPKFPSVPHLPSEKNSNASNC
jgi:hypothetical protein